MKKKQFLTQVTRGKIYFMPYIIFVGRNITTACAGQILFYEHKKNPACIAHRLFGTEKNYVTIYK